MIGFLNRLLGTALEKIVLAAGALAATVAILWRTKHKGRLEEREAQEARRNAELAESQRRHMDDSRKLSEKRNEVDRLSDDAVADRLRDKWTRDQNR